MTADVTTETSADLTADLTADARLVESRLAAGGLSGRRAAVVCYRFGPQDSFIAAHEDGATTPLVEFLPLPVRGGDLLRAVADVDENAVRLIGAFERAYPDTVDRLRGFALDPPEPTSVLGWLLGATSLVLDLAADDLPRALGDSPGVAVDVVVISEDGRYLVDSRRVLRSVMSYRLAGAPGHVVARSVFESLGGFAADAVRRLTRTWPAEVVVCLGDLFAGNVILRRRVGGDLAGLRLPVLLPDTPA